MAEIKNRELSQFSSFLHVDNDNQSIGIASDATPFIGIGTVNPLSKVEIVGNVRVTGFVTATSLNLGTLTLNSGVSTSAIITSIDGANLNYTGVGTINSLESNTGIITTLSGTDATYTNLTVTNGNITNLSGTGITYTNLNVTTASITSSATVANLSGSTINYSGLSTFSGVKIQSGIITATNSGIVTYYGDGQYLTNVPAFVQSKSDGTQVGTSLTSINFTNGNGGVTFTPNTLTVNLGASASGSSNAVQYKNASGIFSGSSNFTFDPATNIVSIAGTCSATNFNSTSDINLKDNIETISDALNIVSNLRGVNFTWKSNGAPSVGVIAQEVEKVLPQLVTSGDPKTVNYDGIIGVLIEAIKELKEEINNLKQGM